MSTKLDGENSSLYRDYIHARSVSSSSDPTRHWLKNFHAKIGWEIPDGWRLCGENLFAKHSISYQSLSTFFMIFSIWNDKNFCLSWQETKEWASLLGMETVPVLYEGLYDENLIKGLYQPFVDGQEMEGYVIRLADSFHYRDFCKSVGKYVSETFKISNQHWLRTWTPNKLAGDKS